MQNNDCNMLALPAANPSCNVTVVLSTAAAWFLNNSMLFSVTQTVFRRWQQAQAEIDRMLLSSQLCVVCQVPVR